MSCFYFLCTKSMFYHARISRIASSHLILTITKPLQTLSTQSSPKFSFPISQSQQQCTQQRKPQDLLSLCSTTKSLLQTQQAHAVAITHGLLPISISISSALILRYAAFSADPTIIRTLFDQSLPFSRSAFLYNTLIRAQMIMGVADYSGFEIYNGMLRIGVAPDDHTFPFVIKLCSDFMEFRKGLEVHGLVVKSGFDYDVFVNNTLMFFYGNFGDLVGARKVFEEMPERDLISWNSIIRVFSDNGCYFEAIGMFRKMGLWSEFKPNEVSIVSVLPVCAVLEDGMVVSEIHCYVIKVGLDCQVTVGNAFVDAYGKCLNVESSRRVFDEMVERNEVSWNTMIGTFAHNVFNNHALESFRFMINEGWKVNSTTVSSLLPVLVELGEFSRGREVHGFCLRTGLECDVFVANALIDMYAKSGRSAQASAVFHKMGIRNVVSWNTMVANFAQNKLELEAIGLFAEMQSCGETPTSVTLTNVLPACARIGCLRSGKEIHASSVRNGSVTDLFVSNAITDMYAKCGCLNLAQNVFDVSLRDEVSYNILIIGYSQTSYCSKSLILFSEMVTTGMKHGTVSFVGVLSACATISAIKQGKEIHAFAVRRLFHEHLFVSNSLLDLYTKCGQIDLSQKIFDRIEDRDVASWNTMILGYGMLGDLRTAIDMFEAMREDGVEHDSVSYIAVLSACSHGGLVDRGKKYFNDMLAHNIEPSQMHYACMVDLLGRSGLMDEAINLITGLPFKPDGNIWAALLGACKLHGNVDLGSWAAEHLLELQPEHPGYYALLSNMYAEAGRWGEADRIRELMKLRGVKKNPGYSWVQVQDKMHAFIVGQRLEGLDPCLSLESVG
ncbi:PREDICTED: pentatricopeptide repeat-containing protein At3g16610-like [Nicotiana attenuata]|uniref:Pentatricopeptide repeat-containing protein n=1 Tax=Nicotiana attenuata TaxID=49451 RepID=A0A1J6I2C3_NICAT|nr:PREDICTED: pentatricopeptide repeat-containing protein At3g16610-like [Nicotiana attenuata]OIS99212.1 pentatricopeptide repeat-containing protein [Nicotiana attenuata]